jgi:hypothetical protein
LAKRGEGRFSEAYVFFIMDSLVIAWHKEGGENGRGSKENPRILEMA